MALSTNSIIHFTKKMSSLKGILKNGFQVFYSTELLKTSNKGNMHAAFPMISFCDIPLTQVKKHLDSYGNYGIGLKKSWAKSNKLNPVLYFDQNSELIEFFKSEFVRLNNKLKSSQIKLVDIIYLIKILSYSKNFEGDLTRKSKTINNYRFFDEREWRFVPNSTMLKKAKAFIYTQDYIKDPVKYNKTLNHIKVTFKPNQISYIIVKDESNIKSITKYIRNIFASKCNMDELEIIMTKILTTDQIKSDF